jgi:hypothetical protein
LYLQLEQYMRWLAGDPVLRQGMSVHAAMQMFCAAAGAVGGTDSTQQQASPWQAVIDHSLVSTAASL